jgi:hypothetical protein
MATTNETHPVWTSIYRDASVRCKDNIFDIRYNFVNVHRNEKRRL